MGKGRNGWACETKSLGRSPRWEGTQNTEEIKASLHSQNPKVEDEKKTNTRQPREGLDLESPGK